MTLRFLPRHLRLVQAPVAFTLMLACTHGGCGSSGDEPGRDGPSGHETMPDPMPDDGADADNDGLTNGVERGLGTDIDRVDSDGDGLEDATEVGDIEHPTDSDADGFIDALEHDQLDNDRDHEPDQQDPAEQGGWQVAYARLEPSVIVNDGKDATRLELQIVGARPETVSIGMSAENWMPDRAPDELVVDGKTLGHDFFELYDDGSHGDRHAGDGIYTRGGITTLMKPRPAALGAPVTPRGEVTLGALRVSIEGSEQTRELGYTREPGWQVFRGGLMVRFVEASALAPLTKLGDDAQRTQHVLNVVSAETARAVQRELTSTSSEPQLIWDTVKLVRPALDRLEKDTDFLYVYPATPTYGTQAGLHHSITSEASGLGADTWEAAPAWNAGKLKSVVFFENRAESPILHETMHHWGVRLAPELGFDPTLHWGLASTYGVLGGFDPATLVDHGDGTVTVGFFAEWGNDWTTTAFSPIELYLMGFAGPEEVAPITVLSNAQYLSGDDTTVTIQAEQHTVTIDDIVAKHGPRSPDAAHAQVDFEAAFVVFSDHLLSAAEVAFIDSRAQAIGAEASPDIISFHEASRGIGTMRTELSKPKQ